MRKREKRNRKKQDRGIVDFMMVTNHFFHSLKEMAVWKWMIREIRVILHIHRQTLDIWQSSRMYAVSIP